MMVKAMTLARQIQKANSSSFYANLILAKTALLAGDSTKCVTCQPKSRWTRRTTIKPSGCGEWEGLSRRLKPVLSPDLPSEIKQLLAQCYLKKGEMIPFLQIQHSIELLVSSQTHEFVFTFSVGMGSGDNFFSLCFLLIAFTSWSWRW